MHKGEDVLLPPSPKEARSFYCAKLTLHHPSAVTTDYSLYINVFTMAICQAQGAAQLAARLPSMLVPTYVTRKSLTADLLCHHLHCRETPLLMSSLGLTPTPAGVFHRPSVCLED